MLDYLFFHMIWSISMSLLITVIFGLATDAFSRHRFFGEYRVVKLVCLMLFSFGLICGWLLIVASVWAYA
jgi:uncharacterized membrane protein YciS (DUF1049 family)